MPKKTRQPRWQTACGLRLIRAFTMDHNAERLRRHLEREFRRDRRSRDGRRFAMKMRRRAIAKGASA